MANITNKTGAYVLNRVANLGWPRLAACYCHSASSGSTSSWEGAVVTSTPLSSM